MQKPKFNGSIERCSRDVDGIVCFEEDEGGPELTLTYFAGSIVPGGDGPEQMIAREEPDYFAVGAYLESPFRDCHL
jgi:hypothetical protein